MSEIKKALARALKRQTYSGASVCQVSNPLIKSVSVHLNETAVKYVITRIGKEKALDYLVSTAIEEARKDLKKSIEEIVEQMLSRGLPTRNTVAYRDRLRMKEY